MIGEIISGGLTLLGGLLGSKKKKEKTQTKTVTENVVDYQKMSDNARAAGFNPLTALRNGGAAGFSTSTSNSTSTTPTTSAMPQALASVGGILGQAFERKLDPLEAKRRQLDTALVDYQLRQLDKQPAGALYPGSTYSGTKVTPRLVSDLGPSAGKVASSPAARRPVQGPYKPLNSNLKAGDQPEASSLGMDNGEFGIFNPGFIPDAGGALSQVLGEPGEWIGGVAKGVVEIPGYSIYRNAKALWKRAEQRDKSGQTKRDWNNVKKAVGSFYEPRRQVNGGGGAW
ncbi:hypothetical protein [Rhizobium sp.]|uniref:hypothetical protein n=1 Tax=Rhizobium sp. TaxID=391 RepID=UPI003981EA21